jgi:PKD repeat protein
MGVVTNNVTVPTAGASFNPGGNLNVVAAATTTGVRITGWQIYIDSTLIFNEAQTSTSGPIEQNINKNLTLASNTAIGNHTLHVKAFDDAGAVKDITIAIVVAAAPVAGVITQNVTAPANNSNIPSTGTIHVTANATTTGAGITSWEIWLDSVKLYNTAGSSIPVIDQVVTIPTGIALGNHSLLVKCWDNTGTLKQTTLTVIATSGSGIISSGAGTPLGSRTVTSFTTHNVSSAPNYNQSNFPSLFTGSTNHDGTTLATNPVLNDDSENAASPMVISKESLRNLMPAGWAGRIFCHAQVWWGFNNHPAVGFSDQDGPTMDRIIQDLADRGYNGIIPDWYSPTQPTVCNDITVDLIAASCLKAGIKFMVMIDEQYFSSNGYTAATMQAGIIAGINHLMDRYAAHAAYEHYVYNGVSRPLILLWDVAGVGGVNINWSAVRTAVTSHANPLLIQYQAGGFTVVESDGALSWLDTNADKAGAPPSGSSYLTNSFLPACSLHQDKICLSSVWKGFNGTITKNVAWSLGKWLTQRAGQTWLDVWKTNSDYVNTGKRLDYVCTVTLDDLQEGSAVQCGIRTDVVVNLAITGNLLTFTMTGTETTVRRYNLWGSVDGITAILLATCLPTDPKQFDLTALPGLVAGGTYTLYLEAQGMPSLQCHMASQNPIRQFVLNSVPPTAALSADNISGPAPLTVNFDASQSSDANNVITNYRFDFGDGSVAQSGVNQGAAHTYTIAGVYTVTLTVTDSAALVGVATVQITVGPTPVNPNPGTPQQVSLVGLAVQQKKTETVYEVPLKAQNQTMNIKLNGKSYKLTVKWNGSSTSWIMNIADSTGNQVLSGIPLVTGADLLGQYKYLNLGGKLVVQTDGNLAAIPTFANLGDKSHLFFIVET